MILDTWYLSLYLISSIILDHAEVSSLTASSDEVQTDNGCEGEDSTYGQLAGSSQGSMNDLSLYSSPSMPNISLGRPPAHSSTISSTSTGVNSGDSDNNIPLYPNDDVKCTTAIVVRQENAALNHQGLIFAPCEDPDLWGEINCELRDYVAIHGVEQNLDADFSVSKRKYPDKERHIARHINYGRGQPFYKLRTASHSAGPSKSSWTLLLTSLPFTPVTIDSPGKACWLLLSSPLWLSRVCLTSSSFIGLLQSENVKLAPVSEAELRAAYTARLGVPLTGQMLSGTLPFYPTLPAIDGEYNNPNSPGYIHKQMASLEQARPGNILPNMYHGAPITDTQVAHARLNKQGHRPLGRTQSAPLPLGHPMLTGALAMVPTHYEEYLEEKQALGQQQAHNLLKQVITGGTSVIYISQPIPFLSIYPIFSLCHVSPVLSYSSIPVPLSNLLALPCVSSPLLLFHSCRSIQSSRSAMCLQSSLALPFLSLYPIFSLCHVSPVHGYSLHVLPLLQIRQTVLTRAGSRSQTGGIQLEEASEADESAEVMCPSTGGVTRDGCKFWQGKSERHQVIDLTECNVSFAQVIDLTICNVSFAQVIDLTECNVSFAQVIDLTERRTEESEISKQQRDREQFLQQQRDLMMRHTLQVGEGCLLYYSSPMASLVVTDSSLLTSDIC
uniref:histone deacetylase n=1 Tax=Timema californicum TaxID=61474 RepID=A0A7R9JAH9_TIMCA|nr:unnamed protein product [Timema californicum]